MCCAILFPAGPEAVLRQPLEDMKACVSGGAWVQPGEGCTWIPLTHPAIWRGVCFIFRYSISVGSRGWGDLPESLIPFLTLTHPSSPLSPHRLRMSKCLNFYILNSQFIHNDVQVYSVNAQILLSTNRCPPVLNLWFPVRVRLVLTCWCQVCLP